MPAALETRIVFSDDAPSALGRLRLAGTFASSAGVRDQRDPTYALVYVVAGSGRYEDELGNAQPIAPGDLILVFPGVRHSYGPLKGRGWSELYVMFDGPVFDLWRARGLLNPQRPVHRLEPIEYWLGELRSFVELPRPSSRRDRELCVCRFLVLLTAMLGASEQAPTWIERARSLLAVDLGDPIDLTAVAAELGLGYETFRKRFRREAGTSPSAYRSARRLDVARELLTSTSMSHREIAATLGFRDEFHFSKRFKQWTGSAPRDVRRDAGAGSTRMVGE